MLSLYKSSFMEISSYLAKYFSSTLLAVGGGPVPFSVFSIGSFAGVAIALADFAVSESLEFSAKVALASVWNFMGEGTSPAVEFKTWLMSYLSDIIFIL